MNITMDDNTKTILLAIISALAVIGGILAGAYAGRSKR